MSKKMIGVPLEGFAQLCREAAAQGAVLLRNEENTLPVEDGECVSVFGRIQITLSFLTFSRIQSL